MSQKTSPGARRGATAVARLVAIGQRYTRRGDGAVVVVYQVHRGDRTVEAHAEGADPRTPGTRFQLGFRELGCEYRLLDREPGSDVA